MKFYKNMFVHKGNLYVREYDNGIEHKFKRKICPSLYFVTDKESEHKSIFGDNLIKLDFDNSFESREWRNSYESQKDKIFGFDKYEYVMLNDMYPDEITFDVSKLVVGFLDIETENEHGGFSGTATTHEKINLISMCKMGLSNDKHITCWGYGEASINMPDASYIKCRDERDLLTRFLNYWVSEYVDVVTAWNVHFDIPYIINRMKMVLGEDMTKRMSPYRILKSDMEMNNFGKEIIKYEIGGITVLDYLEIYRKFKPKVQESYKLDYIAKVELKDSKVEYDCSFKDFYTNHYQKFVEYNIHDTRLVTLLDIKLGYISLAATIGYRAKVALNDVIGTIIVWDVIINNYLSKNNIHVPYGEKKPKIKYAGGYVKSPIVGFYQWMISVDATSLYPSMIMMFNISPEKMVDPSLFIRLTPDDHFRNSAKLQQAKALAKKLNATLCSNGAMFYKDSEGVIPHLTNKFFTTRQSEKSLGKQYEKVSSDIEKILLQRGETA